MWEWLKNKLNSYYTTADVSGSVMGAANGNITRTRNREATAGDYLVESDPSKHTVGPGFRGAVGIQARPLEGTGLGVGINAEMGGIHKNPAELTESVMNFVTISAPIKYYGDKASVFVAPTYNNMRLVDGFAGDIQPMKTFGVKLGGETYIGAPEDGWKAGAALYAPLLGKNHVTYTKTDQLNINDKPYTETNKTDFKLNSFSAEARLSKEFMDGFGEAFVGLKTLGAYSLTKTSSLDTHINGQPYHAETLRDNINSDAIKLAVEVGVKFNLFNGNNNGRSGR